MQSSKRTGVLVVDLTHNASVLTDVLRKETSVDVIPWSASSHLAMFRKPDVVILHADMPTDELVVHLKRILGDYPAAPVIIVCPETRQWQRMDVIAAGATDYIIFSGKGSEAELSREKYRLVFSVKNAMGVLAQKQKIAPALHGAPAREPTRQLGNRDLAVSTAAASAASVRNMADGSVTPFPFQGIIALGGSLGGTEAFLAIARRLSPRIPGMVVVLHMPPVFTRMYAERLNSECAVHVYEAHDKEAVRPGTVLIAPGAMHMRVEKQGSGYIVRCAPGPKITGHCPSVDALFESVADTCGRQAIGIILTGMGNDGAAGMLKMRKRGAYTIGQDEKTSFCYGMPKEAFDCGAVSVQAPLEDIADIMHRRLMSP